MTPARPRRSWSQGTGATRSRCSPSRLRSQPPATDPNVLAPESAAVLSRRLAARPAGSATRVTRLAFLTDHIVASQDGEVTDKGSVNQARGAALPGRGRSRRCMPSRRRRTCCARPVSCNGRLMFSQRTHRHRGVGRLRPRRASSSIRATSPCSTPARGRCSPRPARMTKFADAAALRRWSVFRWSKTSANFEDTQPLRRRHPNPHLQITALRRSSFDVHAPSSCAMAMRLRGGGVRDAGLGGATPGRSRPDQGCRTPAARRWRKALMGQTGANAMTNVGHDPA